MKVRIPYHGRQQVRIGLIVLLLTLFTAIGSSSIPAGAQADTTEEPAATPDATPQPPAQTAGDSGKVLAWIGSGRSAESRPASSPSELGYLNARGEWELLLNLPQSFVGVYPCGDRALSPDGRRFTFLVHEPRAGKDGGTLYQITDAGQPVAVGPAHALTCVGGDPFQYSPDSQRLAYIDFNYSVDRIYVAGVLRLVNAETLQPIAEYGSAASFTLSDRELFFTRFYANQSGAVDEIAVMRATLAAEGAPETEIATLFVPSGCRFTSAQITPIFGKLAILAGQRCASGSQWQLYTLNRDGGALQSSAGVGSGGFAPQTRTAWTIPSWDDRHLLFSVPDGSLNNTARIFTLPMESGTVDSRAALIESGVRFPGYTFNRFPSSNFAMPQISPNGRYWAMLASGTAGNRLQVIDRAQPSVAFELIFVPGTISQLFFSPDSRTLYATNGETTGAANRLQSWDLTTLVVEAAADVSTEEPTADVPPASTILEGAYGRTVIYPDGKAVAAVIWQRGTDSRQTLYQTLARISLEDGSVLSSLLAPQQMIRYNETTGMVNFQRFVYPLAVLGTAPTANQTTP